MVKRGLLLACGLVALGLLGAQYANAEEGAKHPSPPPEAVQACSGLQDGAPCSFTHHNHEVSGTCRTGPQGEAAACLPSGPHHGHHGPPRRRHRPAMDFRMAPPAASLTTGARSAAPVEPVRTVK